MNVGDTYRIGHGTHLWVVISDPQQNPDQIVVVNLTSQRRWQDQACVLFPADHSFIRHETVVYYAEARIVSNAELEDRYAKNLIQ